MNGRHDRLVVALHGSYHTDNFGDMLLMLIMRSWLEEVSPLVEVRMPFVPAATAAVLRPGPALGVKALLGADLFVYGGGGYFGEPAKDAARWSLRLARRHLLPGLAMALLGRGVAVCGVGAGPLSHPLPRAMLRAILRRARPIAVRDEPSRSTLLELGAGAAAVEVTADAALTLHHGMLPPGAAAHARAWIAAQPRGPRLGIHMSRPAAPGAPGRLLADEVLAFASAHPEVQLVGLTDQRGASNQAAAAADLARSLPTRTSVYMYADPWHLAALLAELDMVVTTKLHVGIVALALGTPVLSVPSHTKTPRLYRQIGAPDACHPLAELRPGWVVAQLERRFGRPEGVTVVPPAVRAAAERNRELLQRFVRDRLGMD